MSRTKPIIWATCPHCDERFDVRAALRSDEPVRERMLDPQVNVERAGDWISLSDGGMIVTVPAWWLISKEKEDA